MELSQLGWPNAATPPQDGGVGRVIEELKHHYRVMGPFGERLCKITGRLRKNQNVSQLPKVGDWVVLDPTQDWSLIVAVLPRRNELSRKVPGKKTQAHTLVTNLDRVFIVHSLDPSQFNVNRLERMTVLCAQNEIPHTILLTKADVSLDSVSQVEGVRERFSAPVIATSIPLGLGLSELQATIFPQETYTFLGASGVGKSSLINALMGGEIQKTRSVREADYKGYHTTTSRTLLILPSGGIVIDTPGVREAQIWDESKEGLAQAFDDIAEIAFGCHFRDCRHGAETDCAVRDALITGILSRARYDHYLKIRGEQDQLKQRKWEKRKR
jgi:ribosome biogenesis GTPase